MSRRRIAFTLVASLALLAVVACKSDPTGAEEELDLVYPHWAGSYDDDEATLYHYNNSGEQTGWALCQMKLLITGSGDNLLVKIDWSWSSSGTPETGGFKFVGVPNESDSGLQFEKVWEIGTKYKFTASRGIESPREISLRYYKYKIKDDGSEILQRRVIGRVR